MNTLVLDASVVTKLVLREPDSDIALSLLGRPKANFIAPSLLQIEVACVIGKYLRRGLIDQAKSIESFEALMSIPLSYIDNGHLLRTAFNLASTTSSSIYDCLYLAAAVEHDATLITADTRFVNSLAKTPLGKRVRALGDVA
jgi:predicted nucleic acid-binding protein